ncbi:hypothetical protein RvVAR031_03550 [Agrobacterium vitis]|nr:hypothetical protein RvVAR031_03550 [Agrobacterium vitis]
MAGNGDDGTGWAFGHGRMKPRERVILLDAFEEVLSNFDGWRRKFGCFLGFCLQKNEKNKKSACGTHICPNRYDSEITGSAQ